MKYRKGVVHVYAVKVEQRKKGPGRPPRDIERRCGVNLDSCRDCRYWRSIYWFGIIRCCHYLLDNDHSRKRNGNVCLSKESARAADKRVVKSPWWW